MQVFNPVQFFNRSSLYVALVVAWVAMLGSLYFSEVKGYLPCDLCWYQRILMYPLTVILAVGLLRQDGSLPYLVLPFTIIGQGVSTYHYLLEKTTIFGAPTVCRSGVPCTVAWINWLGFITIPFLAMTAFFIITIMCLIALTAGEPDEIANRPSPWWQVGGLIAAVILAFVLLYQWEGGKVQALTLTQLPGVAMQSAPAAAPVSQAATAGNDSEALDEGRQLYLASCAVCHGEDAQGMPGLGKSLVDSDVIHGNDADALALIRAGVAPDDPRNTTGVIMPPSGGRPDLSDQQLLAIINHVRSLR
ncbi:MAG TPA: disulfide oxidoreductase [Caldilineaceae bacterium]|nr:disulfide oxidoreductase [Caldilineaceae bacterium]